MMKYIFDVDGTLTPSRARIDKEFCCWFSKFAEKNDVYLVTGSDRDKTIEQVGEVVYNRAKKVYQCSGNDVWIRDIRIRTVDFNISTELEEALMQEVSSSRFYHKTGYHIEKRNGLVNFSVCGRGVSLETRVMYNQWDEHKNERYSIVERLSNVWDEYEFKVAGETGIDITAKGSNKSQILTDFEKYDTIWFFGDKTSSGGNDYEIASAVSNRGGRNKVFTVNEWRDTWSILKEK
jgi:phosphomannomutase